MKFKVDESLPSDFGALLRSGGHDAHSVIDEQLCGAADPIIAGICQAEQRILVTLDLDFAHIRNYPPQDYHGIIVLRLPRQDRNTGLALVPRILTLLQTERIGQRLWIVDEQWTRIRGDA